MNDELKEHLNMGRPLSYMGRCIRCDALVKLSYPGGECFCGKRYKFAENMGWAEWVEEYKWEDL